MSFWERVLLRISARRRRAYEERLNTEMLRLVRDAPDEPVVILP
jgi:hypothetical protein